MSKSPTLPRWQVEAENKLLSRGPFKMRLGSKTFCFKYAEDYSNARRALSHGRFTDVGQMVDLIKSMPSGY